MPSTQTRTKLRAFQLDAALPLDPEKENRLEAPVQADSTPKADKVASDTEGAFETPRLPQGRFLAPPSTPGARLPLSDLVGNTDDTSRHAALAVISPEEQLYWRGSQPTNTPVPRANRKRARSSSPAGPSQDESRLSARKPGLTTPQADPATELWTRYTSRKTPTVNKKSVAFAHLINESSPRSAAAVGSVNGLRRWASCGLEFPASTKKRRRTHGIFQEAHDELDEHVYVAAPSSDSVMQGQTSTTNLASMVQRMKESISNSQDQAPSSSSPLPDTGYASAAFPESPLKRHSPNFRVDKQTSESLHAENRVQDDVLPGEIESAEAYSQDQLETEQQQTSPSSDEFGEVDFDTDMADVANAGTLQTELSAASHVHSKTPPVESAASVAVHALPADSDDEFGIEDDDDVFAADLEQVASLFDDRPLESPVLPATANEAVPVAHDSPVIDLINDDSDEFGDDIDPDEFAAAEIAATQIPATNPVCNAHPTRNANV
jgi:DNA replication ATP-dependent helicase Dna2